MRRASIGVTERSGFCTLAGTVLLSGVVVHRDEPPPRDDTAAGRYGAGRFDWLRFKDLGGKVRNFPAPFRAPEAGVL
jgi:hypothetical protein